MTGMRDDGDGFDLGSLGRAGGTAEPEGRGRAGPTAADREIGERIRTRRQALGLSQTRLADAVGVTFQQVQKYERGANRVSASRLADLARALDVPVQHFHAGADAQGGPAPRAVRGFAEAQAGFETGAEGGRARDGAALLDAFWRIRDAEQRRLLLALVERMAG